MTPNYLTQFGHYVSIRFPWQWMLPLASNRFLLPYLIIHLTCVDTPLSVSIMVVGCVSCLIFLLTQRISDDVLDEHEDRLLAAHGADEYQNRPLVTGVITANELIRFRHLLFLLLIGVQLTLIFTQTKFQNVTALVLTPTLCYIYINHISWRISSYFPGSTAIIFTLYALSLVSYEQNYSTNQFDYSLIMLPLVSSTIVLWLPIVNWQLCKTLTAPAELEFKETRRRLTVITFLALATTLALISLLFKLQLAWVLLPLLILAGLNTYLYLVSLKNMMPHPWFHQSTLSLTLFQYFILPIAILIKLALTQPLP